VNALVGAAVAAVSFGLAVAVGTWLSWRSPAVLSEEDTPLRPRITDGSGRPAGPDAEAMGVLDGGRIVTGPPPPGGVPTDAPRAHLAPRRRRRVSRRRSRLRRAFARRRAATGRPDAGSPAPSDVLAPARSDIVAGLRGLERRYRELFDGLAEDESPDDLARRPGPDGWTVLDHIVAATQAIAAADRSLARVLTADAPTARPDEVDPVGARRPPLATASAGSVDERLAELGRVATAAADRIEGVPSRAWSRPATVADGSGPTMTALDLARAMLAAGVHHLRAAGDVLPTVRRPSFPRR
jgi:hypothetical protein